MRSCLGQFERENNVDGNLSHNLSCLYLLTGPQKNTLRVITYIFFIQGHTLSKASSYFMFTKLFLLFISPFYKLRAPDGILVPASWKICPHLWRLK